MKKSLSLLIILSMLLSLALPTLGAMAAAKDATFPKVAIKMSDMGIVTKAGLKASTEYTKSGAFTAVLEGNALKKSTTLPVEVTDFTGAEYVEFNMYSPVATATAFALAFVSDNPTTASLDYYYTVVACNYQGWKLNSFRIQSLRKTGTPLGINAIEKAMLIPGHGGSMVDPTAKLFIDDIVLTAEESEGANVEQTDKVELEPLVLWEAQEGGKGIVEKAGKLAYQWGPGEEQMEKGGMRVELPKDGSAAKYKDIVIEIYSAKNTGQGIWVPMYGVDNPDTTKTDFYKTTFSITWEGEWREIHLAMSGGLEDVGVFTKTTGTPVMKPYEGTNFSMAARFNTTDNVFYDTEIYISKIYLDGERTRKVVENPTGEIILPDNYDPDTMKDFVAMVKEKHPDKHHPRLLVTDEILNRIKKYKDTDPFMKTAYNAVKKKADDYLTTAPTPGQYLGSSGVSAFNRDVEQVAKNCGFMYLLTDDPIEKAKYADRIWLEVENMFNTELPWTETSTGLDAGHVCNGFALAYDWCYDYWSRDQKRLMRNALMEKAFTYAMNTRNGGGYFAFRNNVVGANTKGFVTAFLAICDEEGYENLSNEFLNNIDKYFAEALLYQFQPDGNYSEGLGYWRYAYYSTLFFTNAMKTAMGTDMGLENYPGMKETVYFPFAMRGPVTGFNHSDSNADIMREGSPLYFYLAELYGITQPAAYRLETYEQYGGAEADDLLWYNPEFDYPVDWRQGFPKDRILDGLDPIAVFRTGYGPDDIYLASKGGNHKTGHDHLDGGSFVLDVFGSRWFSDPGAELYFPELPRGYYYRIRTEGHNCIVFDQKGEGKIGQTTAVNMFDGKTPFIASGSAPGAAYAVYNMEPCYDGIVTEYRRGFALVNNRTQMIIRDEFELPKSTDLYSYYHTPKANEITINPDGRSLTMKNKAGEMLKVKFVTDIKDLEVSVGEAVNHPSSPVPGPDGLDNSNLQKIILHTDNVQKGTITMVITPMLEDMPVVMPEILPVSEWDKYLEDNTALTGISIDGIPLAEFEQGVGSYIFESEKVGTVTATAAEGVELEITQANAMGQAALIKATNKQTGDTFTYKVSFTPLTIPGVSSGVDFEKIETELISEEIRPPELLHDGDISTRFTQDAYDGSANFTIDLGSSRFLTDFSVSFYGGKSRKNKFTVEFSEDKTNWTTVFDGFSPGDTDALVAYKITPAWARYIRFTGWGCYAGDEETPISSWNSINELIFSEQVVDFADTNGHWAQNEILFSREHKLVNGMGDNMYMPENSVTRAEFFTMMTRASKFTEVPYEDGTFGDVKKDDWYSTAIMTAKDKGIIPPEMMADGNIYPNQNLTREEMCAIAVLSYTASAHRQVISANMTSIFTDLSDGPYLTYIDKAIGLRITNGMSANTFAPKANITRAQAAAILRRVYLKVFNVAN